MNFIAEIPADGDRALALKGEWTVFHAAEILREAAGLSATQGRTLDLGGVTKLDTAGAWLLRHHFPGARFRGASGTQCAMLDFAAEQQPEAPLPRQPPAVAQFFVRTGRAAAQNAAFLYEILCLTGAIGGRLLHNLRYPRGFRLPSLARHVRETGFDAVPIVGLLAFGISMVISYQGAIQLRRFGASVFAIDMTVISLLREMAVLVTAIMVAGRSGSAFAAELGVMKTRGEVDALRVMGMDPVETLVVPRLLAMLVTLPALAFVADVVGLAGGGLMALFQLGMSPAAYLDRVRDIATPTMFFVGMIKAPAFALLITAVCAYQGLAAKGSAEDVGKVTTLAVVQSIFLVIMTDAIFSIYFSAVDI